MKGMAKMNKRKRRECLHGNYYKCIDGMGRHFVCEDCGKKLYGVDGVWR